MRIQIRIWDPLSRTNADPCGSGSGSWSDFKVTKVEFLHETKTFLRRYSYLQKPFRLSISMLLYSDPDPHSKYVSGSESRTANQCGSVLIRIHNTAQNRSLILKTGLILMGHKFWISKSESLTGLESSRIGSRFNQVSGSGSRRAKMTHKNRKNLEIPCSDVLDVPSVLFWGLRASSVARTSFMEV
jgi:hypothetical protein